MGTVDGFSLLDVKARRVGQHIVDIEVLHQLLDGEDVLVSAQRPAQQGQVVQEAFRDEATLPVQEQAGFGIALGELFVALAHHVGQVPELRHVLRNANGIEGTVEGDLAGSGAEQVLAAQHVRDSHQGIIQRVHQRVQRCPVGADHGEVRYGAGFEGDLAPDQVLEGQVLVRHAQAEYSLAAFGLVLGELLPGDVAVKTVIAQLGVPAGRTVPGFDFIRRGVGLVNVAACLQPRNDILVDVAALGLAVRLVRAAHLDALVPADAQPLQCVQQLVVTFLAVPG